MINWQCKSPTPETLSLKKPEAQVLEKKVASYQALSSYGFLHKGSFCRFRVFGFSGFQFPKLFLKFCIGHMRVYSSVERSSPMSRKLDSEGSTGT